jgi:hypothetical protein
MLLRLRKFHLRTRYRGDCHVSVIYARARSRNVLSVGCLLLCTGVPSASVGQIIDHLPIAVTSSDDLTTFIGTLGPVRATGGYHPRLDDGDTNQSVPAISATVWGNIPAGTAIGQIDYFVRASGTTQWYPCVSETYPDPRSGYPAKRQRCGPHAPIRFEITNANFNCANIATDDRFLRTAFTFQHASQQGLDFQAVVHLLKCTSASGGFKSN